MLIRVISAIVLLAIFIPILLIGKLPYAILMSLIAVMGVFEMFKSRKKERNIPYLLEILSYVLVALFVLMNYKLTTKLTLDALTFYVDYRIFAIFILAYMTPLVFLNDKKKYNINDALFLIGTTLFIGISSSLLISIRNLGIEYIIYIFLIAIITDTFALITGSKIGKNKLSPLISPNKTIEGAFGGSIMGTLVASTYLIECGVVNSSTLFIIIMTLVLSIIGQIGDLAFSAIKRYYGIKDFSNLIPGHGGILDRLDSIIFIVLGFLLFLSIL